MIQHRKMSAREKKQYRRSLLRLKYIPLKEILLAARKIRATYGMSCFKSFPTIVHMMDFADQFCDDKIDFVD